MNWKKVNNHWGMNVVLGIILPFLFSAGLEAENSAIGNPVLDNWAIFSQPGNNNPGAIAPSKSSFISSKVRKHLHKKIHRAMILPAGASKTEGQTRTDARRIRTVMKSGHSETVTVL